MTNYVNDAAYKDMLNKHMLPTMWPQFGEDPLLFQHDCAPVRKGSSIKIRFDVFEVEELQCPALSPDLNPTEHLCNELEG